MSKVISQTTESDVLGADYGEGSSALGLLSPDHDIDNITNSLPNLRLDESVVFIDSVDKVRIAVAELKASPASSPSMFVDLEGVRVSRQGSISILQIYLASAKRTFLFDVHNLNREVFDVAAKGGATLRALLESAVVPKVFFDVRNDSDALFSHFNIKLAGVIDLQVMEFATRQFNRRFVNGLAKCMERDIQMTIGERAQWLEVKEKGVMLFAPEKGGGYEVFNERPLRPEILKYCVQDVQWLPQLHSLYSQRLKAKSWLRKKIELATLRRVEESQSSAYNGHGKHKAIGPW